jgi:hypothetical protein
MKRLVIFFMAVLLCSAVLEAQCPTGIWGDCDCDGNCNVSDAVWLVNWIFNGTTTTPPSADCECDDYFGLGMGDVMQMLCYFYFGGNIYDNTPTFMPQASNLKFKQSRRLKVQNVGDTKILDVFLMAKKNYCGGTNEFYGFMAPFSYASTGDEQHFDIITITTPFLYVHDPAKKYFVIYSYDPYNPVISGTGKHILATIKFERVAGGGAGTDALELPVVQFENFHQEVICTACSGHKQEGRAIIPNYAGVDETYGETNCDDVVNVSDAVWIINYVFVGGPEPGDCGDR